MTYSTHDVGDMSQQAVVTVSRFDILASYIEIDIFKLAGRNIPKGIYQNICWRYSKEISRNKLMILNRILLAGGVCWMLKAYLYALFPPASGSELGDTKSLLVGSEEVTQMFCQFAQA